jgi:hypothetical protein
LGIRAAENKNDKNYGWGNLVSLKPVNENNNIIIKINNNNKKK